MNLHGSNINPAALKDVKNVKDLKKLEIFSHLPNEDEANADLWAALHPEEVKEEKQTADVKPAATK